MGGYQMMGNAGGGWNIGIKICGLNYLSFEKRGEVEQRGRVMDWFWWG
tara:strand:- start:1438 stop:1581 length:144 start_codon:yes stop_codon:yes gene_type:complete